MLTSRSHIPHVAIFIETSRSYGRGLLRGVRKYLSLKGPWSVFVESRGLQSKPPPWLNNWRGDGILTRTDSQRMSDIIHKVGVPTVELRATRLPIGFPFIGVDNQATGRLVAEHLLDRGFRSFGIYDLDVETYFSQRRETFIEVISEKGHQISVLHASGHRDRPTDWERNQDKLVEWLRSLPKPVGIMACNDQLGFWLLDACRRAEISVPEEVAVVGAEDDETLCEVSIPTMSSVQFNPELIGYEAAVLLESLMSGGGVPAYPQLIPPLGITVRQSSDILAIEDRNLANALNFIRQNACTGITVADVLKSVPISRSSLERKTRDLLGRSPQTEIMRIKIEQVKRLLLVSDATLDVVARRSGFSSAQVLCERFRNEVGMTPGAYRKQVRGDEHPVGCS